MASDFEPLGDSEVQLQTGLSDPSVEPVCPPQPWLTTVKLTNYMSTKFDIFLPKQHKPLAVDPLMLSKPNWFVITIWDPQNNQMQKTKLGSIWGVSCKIDRGETSGESNRYRHEGFALTVGDCVSPRPLLHFLVGGLLPTP